MCHEHDAQLLIHNHQWRIRAFANECMMLVRAIPYGIQAPAYVATPDGRCEIKSSQWKLM